MSAAPSHQFLFQAMTATGGKKFGFRAAPSESALAEELRRDHLMLLRAWKLPGTAAATRRIPLKDEVLLNEQLHALLDRGVPLVDALEVAASVVSKQTQPTVEKLREFVAAGDSFAGACTKAGGFDPVAIAVYVSAERTGDLATAAGRLMTAARRRMKLLGRAITMMIYPSAIATLSLLVVTAMLAFIVPMIGRQLDDTGGQVQINAFSRVVIDASYWINANFNYILLGVVLAIIAIIAFRERVGAFFMRVFNRLPVIRSLVLTIELARFFAIMGAMTRSGVPLADALGTATKLISSQTLRGQLEWLRQSLVDGGVLRNLIERVDALPFATRKLLIAAERSGDLDAAFETLSADMADEVDKKSERLMALLEPAVILTMFALIGPLLLAIALPLLTMSIEGDA